MTENDSKDPDPVRKARLREKAVERLRVYESVLRSSPSDAEVRRLVYELQVHQIELEMQNEELRRAQLEAQEASEKYRDLFDFAPVGYFLWDRQGTILQLNLAGAALLGLNRSQAHGTWFGQFVAPQDRGHFAGFLQRAVEAEAKQTCEVKLLRGNEPIVVRVEGIAGRQQPDASPVCFAAVVDITQQKRTDEALRQAKAAAEQANHAKDHFLAVLSHELRTPLTPVVMGLSLLQDRPDLDPEARDTLDVIHRNVEIEAELIDDLLDVSRIARGKLQLTREPADLGAIVRRAVDVCRRELEERGVQFEIDFGPGEPHWVEADVSRLQQVFWNLLKNAVKFTLRGGHVSVRLRPQGDAVVVEVVDDGIGIEAEAIERIFNAFEQAERTSIRQFGGLGLGLAICKNLVLLHDGTISAHSAGRGHGATFRVRLPLTAPAGQREMPAAPAPHASAASPLHILLVEDHAVTAKMMGLVLTEEGHTVETAGDLATGVELAAKQDFDLLLSDLGLPDGSGLDLIRILRAAGKTFPAIALTGFGQEDDIRRCQEAGFAAHLTKPASRQAVVETVAAVAAGRKAS